MSVYRIPAPRPEEPPRWRPSRASCWWRAQRIHAIRWRGPALRWLDRELYRFFMVARAVASVAGVVVALAAVVCLVSWCESLRGTCARSHIEHEVYVGSDRSCRGYNVHNAPEVCLHRSQHTVCDEWCHNYGGPAIRKAVP